MFITYQWAKIWQCTRGGIYAADSLALITRCSGRMEIGISVWVVIADHEWGQRPCCSRFLATLSHNLAMWICGSRILKKECWLPCDQIWCRICEWQPSRCWERSRSPMHHPSPPEWCSSLVIQSFGNSRLQWGQTLQFSGSWCLISWLQPNRDFRLPGTSMYGQSVGEASLFAPWMSCTWCLRPKYGAPCRTWCLIFWWQTSLHS